MKSIVRPMTEDDIENIVSNEVAIFNSSLGKAMLLQELKTNPFAHYFVMEDELHIGYIGLWLVDGKAEVLNFYIVKEKQNQGYGKMLFAYALDFLKKNGCISISLEVRESNEKAISLYKKMGLEVAHVRKNYYHDGENAYLMIGVLE